MRFGLWCALALFLCAGTAPAEERSITIFEGRRIAVPVPAGWHYEESRNPKTGAQTVELADPKNAVQLDVTFFPDSTGRLATRTALEAEMRKDFAFYLGGSVEQDMTFTPFEAPGGLGGYTSFTDRSLVGKPVPAGEKLISTTGMRSWEGAYLLFTLLSNSRDADEFRKALGIVKSGLRETGRKGKETKGR